MSIAMSNPFALEPQAQGLVTLKTNFGDIDVEFFTNQCPRNTKNFLQNCLDGFYKRTIFERVEKDFIAICGGRCDGKDDHEEEKFPDEFHPRLKFCRRGLLATANTAKDDNGSKFFFTLGPTPELQNKNTIFGRVVGNSIYNLLSLNECSVDEDLKPFSEKMIEDVIIKENPYPDLTARERKFRSTPDLKDQELEDDYDPLSKPRPSRAIPQKLSFLNESDNSDEDSDEDDRVIVKQSSTNKLKEAPGDNDEQRPPKRQIKVDPEDESTGGEPSQTDIQGDEPLSARDKRLREIRDQLAAIKKQIESESGAESSVSGAGPAREKPRHLAKSQSLPDSNSNGREVDPRPKRGRNRKHETMEVVNKFRKRLKQLDSIANDAEGVHLHRKSEHSHSEDDELAALDRVDGLDWMQHMFEGERGDAVLAKDANLMSNDWYSYDDPRKRDIPRSPSRSDRTNRRKDHYHHRRPRDHSK